MAKDEPKKRRFSWFGFGRKKKEEPAPDPAPAQEAVEPAPEPAPDVVEEPAPEIPQPAPVSADESSVPVEPAMETAPAGHPGPEPIHSAPPLSAPPLQAPSIADTSVPADTAPETTTPPAQAPTEPEPAPAVEPDGPPADPPATAGPSQDDAREPAQQAPEDRDAPSAQALDGSQTQPSSPDPWADTAPNDKPAQSLKAPVDAGAEETAIDEPAAQEESPSPERQDEDDGHGEDDGRGGEQEEDDEPQHRGFFARLRDGLKRSTSALSEGITGIFTKAKLDDETLEDLEDLLITADLGVDAARDLTQNLAKERYNKAITPGEVRTELAKLIAQRLEPLAQPFMLDAGEKPHVILVVGVNGTGKTTTIGKLAHHFRAEGRSVTLAAGDTFRAAAVEQLTIWAERTGSPIVKRDIGADAAGLAFDALKQAREDGTDLLMIDTAGRLQNKQGLMDELAKIIRVLKKQDAEAPHSVLLVLDATTGQNALNQVEVFKDVAGVTGLIMTKLDGTARGGILVALADKYGLPIHGIGVGEGVEHLQPFDAESYAMALTGGEDD